MRIGHPRRGPKSIGGVIGTLLLVLALYGAQRYGLVPRNGGRTATSAPVAPTAPAPNTSAAGGARAPAALDDGGIPELFRAKKSDTWVEVTAVVDRVLADDTTGEEHQKFLIRVGPDLRVLVAHNTDAAKRVPLKEGDRVRIRGEYEYSDKGGTLHFTHKPKFQRRQPGGWIELDGTRYE